MPKSSKKRKEKAADFAKAKLKLGKGKQTPNNALDTSFKARSIALPTQSIALDKDGDVPMTKRKLTFDTLAMQLKHYNATTRKGSYPSEAPEFLLDAVLGLRELLEGHPELIATHLTILINSCVKLVGDEDSSVRKTLLSFFSWLFSQLPQDDLIPHSAVLLLFTTSAQTHIFPEIRIDAIRFLDVCLEHIPEVVTEGWMRMGSSSHGRRVLEGYLGILNAGTIFGEGGADTGPIQATSTASVVLSSASKLVVLRSLASFLSHALRSFWISRDFAESSSATVTPTWYLASAFSSRRAFEAFDALLRPHETTTSSRQWTEEAQEESADDFVGNFNDALATGPLAWSLNDLEDVDVTMSTLAGDDSAQVTDEDAEVVCVARLARTLQSTLVSTFLDCAPAVFSPSSSPSEVEVQMVLVICRILRSLYGRILEDSAQSGTRHERAENDLQTLLYHFGPYFPFTVTNHPSIRRDVKIEQAFQDLNLIYCELSSFLVLASQRETTATTFPSHRGKRVAGAPAAAAQGRQIERVSAHVMQLLRGQAVDGNGSTNGALPRPISAQAYVALLPTVWSLVNSRIAEGTASSSVFSAIVDHAIRTSSTSAVKRHTIDFVGRLVLLDGEPEYVGSLRLGRNLVQDAKLEEWITQLPRTLWELGGNNPTTTEVIARFLLRLSQRGSPLLRPTVSTAMRSRLTPYFSVMHPTKGKMSGPFAKLPATSAARRLILDLVTTIVGPPSPADTDDLRSTAADAVQGTADWDYWTGISRRMGRAH
ncbi:uncharacterized protein BXZ73DRAFT_39165 [Epithele typhae]|uniref:uncharacterized protein n=1 Tax=Epithele typhae TaxID=378194 RepID=UPI0020079896|nr:uncharacterized protein BXZ73DRAFT_39165 [Epithele typhae]KAH9944068.1 hypothetical protein BXZ73DRAFT_39165 [Epithele typhae]